MDQNKWGLNKSQRMQLKAFVCLLGILLLVVLLLGKLILMIIHREEEELPMPHVPVIQIYRNVWVMEADDEGLTIFRDGQREEYPWGEAGTDAEGNVLLYCPEDSIREQVADVMLTDGAVTGTVPKTNKINGKILGADASGVEVEGYGRLPLASDYKGYRLYDSLEMCTVENLRFGYNFTDLCMENGEICGVLMAKEEAMEYIRVLISGSEYGGNFHEEVVLSCDVDYTVIYGAYDAIKQERHPAGEELTFGRDSSYFESNRIRIVPDVLTGKITLKNCGRSQGIPSYRGQMELLAAESGLVVVNEVLLEEYLYSVVPSEMPSRYPAEALKAQAICARTYAYGHMEHAGYPQYGAHVDDSTTYQVYNNILEQESTTTAAKETYGQLLFREPGTLAGTYYYSTSCGVGSDANVWKTEAAPTLTYLRAKSLSKTAMRAEIAQGDQSQEQIVAVGNMQGGEKEENAWKAEGNGENLGENGVSWEAGDELGEILREEAAFEAFISTVNEDDFEAGEGWYRWSYEVEELDKEHMLEALQKRYSANSKLILTWKDEEYVSEKIDRLDDIQEIYIESRGSGGVADELVIETLSQKIKVISEHNIRYVLNDGKAAVIRQDGSKASCPTLLPSGFFIIKTGKENGNVVRYALIGGGFGHGVGMSQNGAMEMARAGYSAEEILLYFYEGCMIESIYE